MTQPPMAHRVRAIHPYGPRVGEYIARQGTVPATFDRARQQMQASEFENFMNHMREVAHEGTR